jgi:rubredoxin
MKAELLIFGVTGFLVVNTYYDGKYTQMLQGWQKYLKMTMFAFIGLSLYVLIKKKPIESKGLLKHANDIIRYMPIDKNTANLISPIFDFTNAHQQIHGENLPPQTKRMMNSGGISHSRSVSETKKKFVAAQQNWKCSHCGRQLDASFQVDHKIRLADGGTNHVNNLDALCPNCHGKKTTMENMK